MELSHCLLLRFIEEMSLMFMDSVVSLLETVRESGFLVSHESATLRLQRLLIRGPSSISPMKRWTWTWSNVPQQHPRQLWLIYIQDLLGFRDTNWRVLSEVGWFCKRRTHYIGVHRHTTSLSLICPP